MDEIGCDERPSEHRLRHMNMRGIAREVCGEGTVRLPDLRVTQARSAGREARLNVSGTSSLFEDGAGHLAAAMATTKVKADPHGGGNLRDLPQSATSASRPDCPM